MPAVARWAQPVFPPWLQLSQHRAWSGEAWPKHTSRRHRCSSALQCPGNDGQPLPRQGFAQWQGTGKAARHAGLAIAFSDAYIFLFLAPPRLARLVGFRIPSAHGKDSHRENGDCLVCGSVLNASSSWPLALAPPSLASLPLPSASLTSSGSASGA